MEESIDRFKVVSESQFYRKVAQMFDLFATICESIR